MKPLSPNMELIYRALLAATEGGKKEVKGCLRIVGVIPSQLANASWGLAVRKLIKREATDGHNSSLGSFFRVLKIIPGLEPLPADQWKILPVSSGKTGRPADVAFTTDHGSAPERWMDNGDFSKAFYKALGSRKYSDDDLKFAPKAGVVQNAGMWAHP